MWGNKMKMHVILNSKDNIVGIAQPSHKGAKSGNEAGLHPMPGQSVHEVEVPEEMKKLDGVEILRKLNETDIVKKALRKTATAGVVVVKR